MTLRTILKFSFILNIFIVNSQKYSEIGNHDFNEDWEFKLLENTSIQDGEKYIDWTKINIPHDWSVDFSFDASKGEGATGYLPGGKGLYRKEFKFKNSKSTTTYVLFDGIYNNSKVYLNDKLLGFHPYGYSPFYFDITDYLNTKGDENMIKVDVDRKRYVDSRWYTGSGIYRNVKFIHKNNLHIPVWGVFIMTPKITSEEAVVNIKSTIKNNNTTDEKFDVVIKIYDDKNNVVTKTNESHLIEANKEIKINQIIKLLKPYLWEIESPRMYQAQIEIRKKNEIIDQNKVRFGVRDIRFDANEGFFLNDIKTDIKGVCLHHDGGIVGAAVPKDVWRRRLEKLKKAGYNGFITAYSKL